MANATFKGYGGAGYVHSHGGGLLQPNDFRGMAALLVEEPGAARGEDRAARRRQRAALRRLLDPALGNPLVQSTLTCLEREVGGSQAWLPVEESSGDEDEGGAANRRGGRRLRARRSGEVLDNGPAIVGAAVSALPLDTAAGHEAMGLDQQSLGDTQARDGGDELQQQPVEAETSVTSPDVAAHTLLFPKGDGGYAATPDACSRQHYLQKTLGSVAPTFARSPEFVWCASPTHDPLLCTAPSLRRRPPRCGPHFSCGRYQFQQIMKRELHQGSSRLVNAHIAQHATELDLLEHNAEMRERWDALQHASPKFVPYCNTSESFTGSVGAHIVGSKAYWNEARRELLAMAEEYGKPAYWATFTCNENGWYASVPSPAPLPVCAPVPGLSGLPRRPSHRIRSDLQAACGGEHHSKRPVEATRQYNRRWQLFLQNYMCGSTPVGEIDRVWWRQEEQVHSSVPAAPAEASRPAPSPLRVPTRHCRATMTQARKSLHIHMCIWITPGTEHDEAIIGTAPRNCRTAAEKQWRNFVLNVQRHDCRAKCFNAGVCVCGSTNARVMRSKYPNSRNIMYTHAECDACGKPWDCK